MSAGLVVGLTLLGLILSSSLIVGLILLARYLTRTRGDYYTQEDEGYRDAEDADTAVLQSRTGLPVHKKKEWYI